MRSAEPSISSGPTHSKRAPSILARAAVCATASLYGCAATVDSPEHRPDSANSSPRTSVRSSAAEPRDVPQVQPSSTVIDARPAALVNGTPVNWGDLRPLLNEIAGAQALQELIIDRRLAEALNSAGIIISDDDVARERRTLLDSLSDDPNVALRLLDELRNRQQLGKVRFESLMRRNAGLRALVRDNVSINDQAVRNMHDTVHGPKRQARLMVLNDLESAQAAINLVNSGISFNDVTAEMSIDSSAPRGGLLAPISESDPAYPEALRQTLWTLEPGQMSGPILLDGKYAVVMLVKRIAGDGTAMEDVRPSLERLVRLSQERLLMDQLARRMLSDTAVSIFDDELHESWKRRTPSGS